MIDSIREFAVSKANEITAFLFGDFFTTLVVYGIGIPGFDLLHPIWQIISPILIGAAGGLGTLIIGDLYPKTKKWLFKKKPGKQ